jgi:hypothetical protein
MPDQPEDPLHYDMKIPPEKNPPQPGDDSEDASSDDRARESNSAKAKEDAPSADKTQSGRQGE